MKKHRIDIHDYDGRLRRQKALLQASGIPGDDKKAIEEYARALFLAGVSKPRIDKEACTVRLFAERLKTGLAGATKEDLMRVMEAIQREPRYSVWTKADYASIVKKFYHWLEKGDEARTSRDFPPRVAWIRCGVRKKDQPRLQRSDMLAEEDVRRLLDAADSPRDKALIAVLWDTGARIGEIGSLNVGSIAFSDAGTHIDMRGKTGQRTPFVIECTPHLVRWIGIHPRKDDPGAPLWFATNNGKFFPDQAMTYNALVKAIQRAFEHTKIKKGFNPHLFRHSRATWCATNGWTHLEMCKFFGWAPDSTMPAYYTSLVNEDVEARMRKCYGLENRQDKALEKRKPSRCNRCQAINGPEIRFCYRCGMALTLHAAQEAHERRAITDAALNQLCKADPERFKKAVVAALLEAGLK